MSPFQGQLRRNRHAIWLKTAQRFFWILNILPVRAKVKANRSPILLPLQGVDIYALIPRALPWAMNWLPFQGARGASPKRFSRRVRGPHFASKVSYSAAPQSRAHEKFVNSFNSLLRRLRQYIYRCMLRPNHAPMRNSLIRVIRCYADRGNTSSL